ncbi:MAG: DUF1858 domain-containing protein [Chloroflexi bacterium]|nr:DUF1858 domain-containing protein [Chloroflexota bacterium]
MSEEKEPLAQKLPTMSIADVLRQWPQTSKLFIKLNMVCVGCEIAPFCSVTDAARDYNMDVETLVAALIKTIQETDDS